jgi:hypothetical protein
MLFFGAQGKQATDSLGAEGITENVGRKAEMMHAGLVL